MKKFNLLLIDLEKKEVFFEIKLIKKIIIHFIINELFHEKNAVFTNSKYNMITISPHKEITIPYKMEKIK